MDKKMHEYFAKKIAYTDDFEIAEEFSADPYSDSPLQNTISHRKRSHTDSTDNENQRSPEKTKET